MNEYTVLCVDDEPNILTALKRLLRKEAYRLMTCSGGEEGLKILAETKVHVIISDQRMPGMNGVELLRRVKESYPDIIRIILTGYTEVDSITKAINEGHIYKFFLKPWNDHHLTLEIRQAIEQYALMEDNRRLYDMTAKQNEELKGINENLEKIVAERTESLALQNQALQLSQAILEDMPTPIVGISAEMVIAFINRAAIEQFSAEAPIDLGATLMDYFEGVEASRMMDILDSGQPTKCTSQGRQSGRKYDFTFIPLTGPFKGRGFILTANPKVATLGPIEPYTG